MKNKTKLKYDEIMEKACCRDMNNRSCRDINNQKGIEEVPITHKGVTYYYLRNKCKVCGQRWITTKEKLFSK